MEKPKTASVAHRPWPLPTGRWTWQQQWYDLLFAHWPIDEEQLRPLMPEGLSVDTYDGRAWIGVVPFRMRIKRRGMPGIPTAYHFPELNVRTYVRHGDRPGVWFFSLDASSRLAVWGARRFFHLPYFYAKMRAHKAAGTVVYQSARPSCSPVRFAAKYRPIARVALAQHGSLEHWLTERYCLFCQAPGGEYYCGEIHHEPWPLQQAEAEIRENTMLAPLGLSLPEVEPLLHFSSSIDVALWPLTNV
jgi:uncharacterized protein YqjF (DUF2071 family)